MVIYQNHIGNPPELGYGITNAEVVDLPGSNHPKEFI